MMGLLHFCHTSEKNATKPYFPIDFLDFLL